MLVVQLTLIHLDLIPGGPIVDKLSTTMRGGESIIIWPHLNLQNWQVAIKFIEPPATILVGVITHLWLPTIHCEWRRDDKT